jgi:hypothetical protein
MIVLGVTNGIRGRKLILWVDLMSLFLSLSLKGAHVNQ